jgi:hypothetical protein
VPQILQHSNSPSGDTSGLRTIADDEELLVPVWNLRRKFSSSLAMQLYEKTNGPAEESDKCANVSIFCSIFTTQQMQYMNQQHMTSSKQRM